MKANWGGGGEIPALTTTGQPWVTMSRQAGGSSWGKSVATLRWARAAGLTPAPGLWPQSASSTHLKAFRALSNLLVGGRPPPGASWRRRKIPRRFFMSLALEGEGGQLALALYTQSRV